MTTPAQTNLQREKIKFEALFHYATIGIVIADSKGNISLINAHAENLFGYSAEEVTGKKVEILLPESVRSRHEKNRKNFAAHPQVRPMGTGLDLIARRKDGSVFAVEISLSYFNSEGGLFVIAFIQDITLRKQKDETLHNQKQELQRITDRVQALNANLEREVENRTRDLKNTLHALEHSRSELEKALEREKRLGELKSRFVTMASHEFKTPLSTILTSATLIEKFRSGEEQEQRSKHLNRISQSVQNLTALLNEFLSLGKLDEGKVRLNSEPLDLALLVGEVVSEMWEQARPGQVFETSITGPVVCTIDKVIFRNILVNLLSNAIKFSPENATIRISGFCREDCCQIHISDQGIGIPESDLEHLFELFFRAGNAENVKGTGLGLHIVKRYVQLLGGEIFVESVLGKGTTFVVQIPKTV